MTYVVAEPCVNCRYTDCAMVCPVDAFHLDDDMLVINPETCIDCDACVPECPVEAIFAEANVPENWAQFTEVNAERALSVLQPVPDVYAPTSGAGRLQNLTFSFRSCESARLIRLQEWGEHARARGLVQFK